MKKITSMFLALILVFSSLNCFATDETTIPEGETTWYDNFSGDTEYLEDYSDYEDLMNSMDEQSEYKSMYEQMIKETVENYKSSSREDIYRAKVVDATDVQTYYGYYQYMYKSIYQIVKVEILEGPYKGQTIDDVNYILTGDTYGNIELPAISVGKVINVSIGTNDEGNIYAYSSSIDSPVSRWGWIALLIVVTLLLVAVFAGKAGMKMLVPILLIVDLIIMVMIPAMHSGTNIMLLLGAIVLLSSITICVLKLGVRTKSFVAILVSLVMTFVFVILMYGFDNLAYLSGITYEITSFVESIIPRINTAGEIEIAMDVHALNIAIAAIMAFFAAIPVICKTIQVYDEKKDGENAIKDTIDEMKEYVSDKLVTIVPMLFTLIIPKYLLLIINKCSFAEIINSEVLGSDVVRILFIVISVVLAVPISANMGKLLIDDAHSARKE